MKDSEMERGIRELEGNRGGVGGKNVYCRSTFELKCIRDSVCVAFDSVFSPLLFSQDNTQLFSILLSFQSSFRPCSVCCGPKH